MRSRALAKLALVLAALGAALPAQDRVTVLTGAKVYPVARPPLVPGVVVLSGGKIQMVGDAGTTIPDGAVVVDCTGMVITPGLIDAATTLGVESRDANEQASEVTPQMRILDAVDPADKAFWHARRAGVTTVQVSPGNRNPIGGLGVVLKTGGDTPADMLLRDDSCLRIAMGDEPSSGNRSPRRGSTDTLYVRRPTTRMGVVWTVRKAFYDALDYRAAKTAGGAEAPLEDAGREVLLRAIDRKLQVRTTARAEQDIRTALRLAEEFGYETVIEEGTEAYQLVDLLKAAKVSVVFGAPSVGHDVDGAVPRWHTLAVLAAAQVPFAIATGSRVGTDGLVRETMFAVRNGLPPDAALAAVTRDAARILGVEDRVGTLEAGKDADLVVWTREPFDPAATVRTTYLNGRAEP
jgi:imidazolonepropionase-like amidohydrolase